MTLPLRCLLFLCGCLTLLPEAYAEPGFQYPLSVAVREKDNSIFVADRNLPGVWKLADGELSVFFQGSKKFRTPLNAVRCVAIDKKGQVLAGDSATREVYRISDAGQATPLTNGGIGIPMSIALDSAGNIFVADLELHRIWKVPPEGGTPEEFAAVPAPRGIFIDAEDRLWIVSHGKNQLLRLSPDAQVETIVEGRPFQFPHTVEVDDAGVAYVCDGYAKTIWKIEPGKKPEKLASGAPLDNPVGLALQGDALLVADPRAGGIYRVDAAGKITKLEWKLADESK